MYPTVNYEMSEDQLKTLLDACKPTPVIKIGGSWGSSPQESANRAWEALGKEMGFDHMTVQPISGKGTRFFSATPNETKEQKAERIQQQEKDKRESEINNLRTLIASLQEQMDLLLSENKI